MMPNARLTAKVLHRAAELVEQGFCQGRTALNAIGHPVGPQSAKAVRWCVDGALNRAAYEITGTEVSAGWPYTWAHAAMQAELQVPFISRWNDEPGRTAAEVAACCRAAAARVAGNGGEG